MILPALQEASIDRTLPPAARAVLLYLHGYLELGEFRTVKHAAVAEMTGLRRARVSRAIHLLVEQGYLREGGRQERNVGSYLLLGTRGIPVPAKPVVSRLHLSTQPRSSGSEAA